MRCDTVFLSQPDAAAVSHIRPTRSSDQPCFHDGVEVVVGELSRNASRKRKRLPAPHGYRRAETQSWTPFRALLRRSNH